MKTHDFLLELGTEELPPKLLKNLSNALKDNLVAELKSLDLTVGEVKAFSTPRRLAVYIADLQSEQEDQLTESCGICFDLSPVVSGSIKGTLGSITLLASGICLRCFLMY